MWVTLNHNTVILIPNPNSGQWSKQLTEKTVYIKPTHLRPSLVISLRLPIESGISGMSLCWRSSEVIWTHFPISMDKEKTTTSNGLISINLASSFEPATISWGKGREKQKKSQDFCNLQKAPSTVYDKDYKSNTRLWFK